MRWTAALAAALTSLAVVGAPAEPPEEQRLELRQAARTLLDPSALASTANRIVVIDPAVTDPGATAPVPDAIPAGTIGGPSPRIVNGLSGTARFPAVGWLIRFDTGENCSGTLIGCDKFLTAAHCADPPIDPAQTMVFFQTRGFVGVTGAAISPGWNSSVLGDADLAVFTLSSTVSGIAPALLNNTVKPALLTEIVLAGWGGVGNATPSLAGTGRGMLRFGNNISDECEPNSVGVSDADSICSYLVDPLEPAGEESGVCTGDSGGPMFAFVPGLGQSALVGVTSGAFGPTPGDCLPPIVGVHTDVDLNYGWIASQAQNLAPVQCSNLETAAAFVNYDAHRRQHGRG